MIYYRINTGDFNVLINSLFNADALCICSGVVNFSLQIASNSIRACITADGNVLTSSRYFSAQLSSKLSVLHFVSISWIFVRFIVISQSKCCLLYRPILNYIYTIKGLPFLPLMSTLPIIEQILQQLGLWDETWVELDRIDAGVEFILANKSLLESLPARVRGDLSFLSSDVDLYRRKAVCSLARRLAKEIESAIIRKRTQHRVNKKTVSIYHYKRITCT